MAIVDINSILRRFGISKSSSIEQYIKPVVGGVAAVLLLVSVYVAYRWHRVNKAQSAQQTLAENMALFGDAVKNDKQQDWIDTAALFKLAYDQNKGTQLAPYFLGFESDAYARADKKAEAAESLQTMLADLPSNSPLRNLFATKHALMMIDMGEEKGAEALKQLASDEANIYRDCALYYLGLYYWTKQEIEPAKELWISLLESEGQSAVAPSPWAGLAEEKLRQIM